jgi:hypothetical protein
MFWRGRLKTDPARRAPAWPGSDGGGALPEGHLRSRSRTGFGVVITAYDLGDVSNKRTAAADRDALE